MKAPELKSNLLDIFRINREIQLLDSERQRTTAKIDELSNERSAIQNRINNSQLEMQFPICMDIDRERFLVDKNNAKVTFKVLNYF